MLPLMARRIALIQGNPDPAPGRFGRALAAAYAAGAAEAGHECRLIEVGALGLPLLETQQEFEHGTPPEALRAAQDSLAWAEHWVVFHPVWLGFPPARLMGFFEQALRPGFAFRYQARGLPEKLMKGRSARLVITMGMPALVHRLWLGASTTALRRNLLGFVGIAPIRITRIGGAARLDAARAGAWLERLRALGRAGA
jgi:putative NADPH-quinone reductase